MSENIDILRTEFGFQFFYHLEGNDYRVEIHYPSDQTSYHMAL